MTTRKTNFAKQRFAWLTPLQAQKIHSGPWMLCDNHTQHLARHDATTVNVTNDALLRLLAAAFTDDDEAPQGRFASHACHESDCKRFEIRRQQPDKDNTRLFVQQPADYFQRLELVVDGRLMVAYHEPVWPHLQDPHELSDTQLNLPVSCMEFLEYKASQNKGAQPSSTSSNQATHRRGNDSAAA